MKYPGYLLNPGDMFQVDPERVLFATGAKKDPAAIAAEAAADAAEPAEDSEATATPEAEAPADSETPAAAAEGEAADAAVSSTDAPAEPASPQDPAKAEREELKALRDRVKTFLKTSFGDLSVKQKKALRALSKDIKGAMSKSRGDSGGEDVNSLSSLFSQLELEASPEQAEKYRGDGAVVNEETGLTRSERERLSELLTEEAENPYDPDKPYATPWRPRPFMGPFAFIPRYLEVNPKICSAVYLRHPVARAGKAEVPSPWGELVNELAFNWYLRRR
jgi:ribosomal protein S4